MCGTLIGESLVELNVMNVINLSEEFFINVGRCCKLLIKLRMEGCNLGQRVFDSINSLLPQLEYLSFGYSFADRVKSMYDRGDKWCNNNGELDKSLGKCLSLQTLRIIGIYESFDMFKHLCSRGEFPGENHSVGGLMCMCVRGRVLYVMFPCMRDCRAFMRALVCVGTVCDDV